MTTFDLLTNGLKLPIEPGDDEKYAQKKCKRCGQYYTNATNSACYYHPGRYNEPKLMEGTMVGWSCCRSAGKMGPKIFELSVLNEKALDKNAKGCTKEDLHEEDQQYTRLMRNFPLDTAAAKAASAQISNDSSTPNPGPPQEDEEFIYHQVQKEDTLMGLSLKYNVSTVDIQRVNRLMGSHDICHLRTIKIPKRALSPHTKPPAPSPTPPRNTTRDFDPYKGAIEELQRLVGCNKDEARFYVSQAAGDLQMALMDYKSDAAYAASNKMPKNSNKKKLL
jgi:LysM repeat protein